MRPKARGLVQHGGLPPSRVWFCMWWTVHFDPWRTTCTFCPGLGLIYYWIYIKHARKAWHGTLVDPCLLSVYGLLSNIFSNRLLYLFDYLNTSIICYTCYIAWPKSFSIILMQSVPRMVCCTSFPALGYTDTAGHILFLCNPKSAYLSCPGLCTRLHLSCLSCSVYPALHFSQGLRCRICQSALFVYSALLPTVFCVGDPWHFSADPDPTPDPTSFFIDFKDATKNIFVSYFFLITCQHAHHLQSPKLNFLLKFCFKILFCRHYFSPLNTSMSKGKVPEPDPDPYLWPINVFIWSQNSLGIYNFFLLYNGSGSGSPKNMRIRIPNTTFFPLQTTCGAGCLKEVYVNDKLVDFLQAAKSRYKVSPGCSMYQDEQPEPVNPCLSHRSHSPPLSNYNIFTFHVVTSSEHGSGESTTDLFLKIFGAFLTLKLCWIYSTYIVRFIVLLAPQ